MWLGYSFALAAVGGVGAVQKSAPSGVIATQGVDCLTNRSLFYRIIRRTLCAFHMFHTHIGVAVSAAQLWARNPSCCCESAPWSQAHQAGLSFQYAEQYKGG